MSNSITSKLVETLFTLNNDFDSEDTNTSPGHSKNLESSLKKIGFNTSQCIIPKNSQIAYYDDIDHFNHAVSVLKDDAAKSKLLQLGWIATIHEPKSSRETNHPMRISFLCVKCTSSSMSESIIKK